MTIDFFSGVLAAVLIGNGLRVLWAYSIFRGDAMMRRGTPESQLPLWIFVGAAIPPLVGFFCLYSALE